MPDIAIRPVTDDEYPAFVLAFMEGFSEDMPSDTFTDMIKSVLPAERTLAAFDGDAIVGTFGGYALDVTVPGGSLPMEGTTVVTVFPTHRRMGLLRSMMQEHLENAARNGYAIAGLWASESDIYGRFGYGIASYYQSYDLRGPDIAFRDDVDVDRIRRVTVDDARELFPPVFDRVLPTKPGMYARTGEWWESEIFRDEDWMKHGRTAKRYVVHEGPAGVEGYAIYRQTAQESDDGHANGKVVVIEFVAATPRAHASLWSYLTQIDGCPNIEHWNVPVDDPLPYIVKEGRRVRVKSRGDALWIRILDVVAALEGRTYEVDGAITFEFVDRFRPETSGVYRIVVDGGDASVAEVDAEPELSIDDDALGGLFLGGQDARAYHAAGRIRGDADAVAELDRLFHTSIQPWCNQVF